MCVCVCISRRVGGALPAPQRLPRPALAPHRPRCELHAAASVSAGGCLGWAGGLPAASTPDSQSHTRPSLTFVPFPALVPPPLPLIVQQPFQSHSQLVTQVPQATSRKSISPEGTCFV